MGKAITSPKSERGAVRIKERDGGYAKSAKRVVSFKVNVARFNMAVGKSAVTVGKAGSESRKATTHTRVPVKK